MNLKGTRIYGLLVFVLAVVCCFLFRLMRYQITNGASYRAKAATSTLQTVTISAPRGEILDRFGRVLATNTVGYSIVLQRAAFPTKTQNDNILKIIGILSQNGVAWSDSIPVGEAPYRFNDNSDNDIKQFRKFFTAIDQTETNKKKQEKELSDDANATADQLMQRLAKRYGVSGNYTASEARTVIGVRYQMEVEGFSYNGTFTIAKNVDINTISQITENRLPGVMVSEQSSRVYTNSTIAPHVIGSVNKISDYTAKQKSLDNKSYKDLGYKLDDIVGTSGIEQAEEKYLHGVNGKETVTINSKGNITGTQIAQNPQPGGNVVLTIDMDLQKILQDSLPVIIQQIRAAAGGNVKYGSTANAGSAVVLNVKTGEVLAMATYPSYDINDYYKDYTALNSDTENAPLLDRCTLGLYRPGSTFKPCTATAGLTYGVITPTSTIKTEEYFHKGTYSCYDEVGGDSKNVETALAQSSNYFFNVVADRLFTNNQYEKLVSTAKALGLGQSTGIELPESKGTVSGPEEKTARGETWYPADAAQSGIGQLDSYFTPIQLANYISTLVKNGSRSKVHVVKYLNSYDNGSVLVDNDSLKDTTDMKISDQVVQTIKQGMQRVTDQQEGTAYNIFANFPLKLGGKTGTAEAPKNGVMYYNGVFVSFAPYDDPDIAVAVVVEHGHNGFQTAPTARDALNYYFVQQPQWQTSPDPLPTVDSALPPKSGVLIR